MVSKDLVSSAEMADFKKLLARKLSSRVKNLPGDEEIILQELLTKIASSREQTEKDCLMEMSVEYQNEIYALNDQCGIYDS